MRKYSYNLRGSDRYAFIPIAFKSPSKTTRIWEGVLDTGSPFLLINQEISNDLQLKLDDWKDDSKGATGTRFKTARAVVDLILGHAHRRETIKDVEIKVSEFNDFPDLPLIGRHPFFYEWYDISFDDIKDRCYLTPK
jgi:predicted aspartyl protease